MTGREPRTVRVDPEAWSAFVEWVVDVEGKKHGEVGRHVENALHEYIDHGREARIEEKVDAILTEVRGDSRTHTHKGPRTVLEKAQVVMERVDTTGVIQGEALDDVIMDVAGFDDRTMEKQKETLKRKGWLYAHPTDTPVWTADKMEFVKWCEAVMNSNPSVDLTALIDEYPVDIDEYDKIVTEQQTEVKL